MKKQKIQMLVVVILLVICVVAYIFISKNAGKLDSTENDGPNASMGNVTESVLETETESVQTTETTEKYLFLVRKFV